MRAFPLLIAFGCSSTTPSTPVVGSPPTNPAPPAIAQFIASDATSVVAWRPQEFPILALVDSTNDEMLACWRGLEERITATYQIFTAAHSALVVLEGDLPRTEMEACADEALGYSRLATEDLRHDGVLSVVTTRFGVVYAGWRDRFVVLGTRDAVTGALATKPAVSWATELGELTKPNAFVTSAYIATGVDGTFGNLLGVATTHWSAALDVPAKPWPPHTIIKDGGGADALERFGKEQERLAARKAAGLPLETPDAAPPVRNPVFSGRVELTFANAGDAARADKALATSTFAIPLEENLAAALAKLPRTIDGTTLAVRFDQASFASVEMDKLQAWLARAQAAVAPKP